MEQESPSIESIFDFFYLDNQKIKSFYAQLTGNGAATSLKRHSGESSTQSMGASLGVPIVTSGKLDSAKSLTEQQERLYDAQPTMPREMIDRLDELGFVERQLSNDALGSLVLLQGRLGVLDVGMLKDVAEPMIHFVTKDAFQNAPANQRAAMSKDHEQVAKAIKGLPFSIETRLLVDGLQGVVDDQVWMTLNRDDLISATHDHNFKHGMFMTGKWYVLGVLDALPFDDFSYVPPDGENEYQSGLRQVLNGLREFVGRPSYAYGMTPVAIFRVIKPRKANS